MTRHVSVRTAVVIGVALAVLAVVSRLAGDGLKGADSESSVREIQFVVRGMTFYVDGENAPNPTLHARPGERIRIVLRNADVGMSHDFVIRSWGVTTQLLKGKGEDSIQFTVPATRGAHVYSCTPHAEMMSGTIVVD